MKSRLEYLEQHGQPIRIEEPEPLDETVNFPLMARYDFAGRGPRDGVEHDVWLFKRAAGLMTAGEKISPRIIRLGWVFIRMAIGLGFLYFVLFGSTLSCEYGEILFN